MEDREDVLLTWKVKKKSSQVSVTCHFPNQWSPELPFKGLLLYHKSEPGIEKFFSSIKHEMEG